MKLLTISWSLLIAGTTIILSADRGVAETVAAIESIVGGQVSLNRFPWQDYRPVQVGASLENGDLIFPEEGVEASVACENGEIWFVPDGIASLVDEGCSESNDTTIRSTGSCGDNNASATQRLICLLQRHPERGGDL